MLDRLVIPGGLVVHGRGVGGVWKRVTPGYFQAVGGTIIAGRSLTAEDGGPTAVVVSESLARRAWPNQSPLGERVPWNRDRQVTVVGVARDEVNFALDAPAQPTVFSLLENPWAGCTGPGCGTVSFVVRTERDSSGFRDQMTRLINTVNPDAVVFEAASIRERLAGSVKDRSFATLVLAFFAFAAVGICTAGVVGIVAFVVTRRTRDVAICIALGARTRDILQMVVGEAVAASASGTVVGLLLGRWASKALEHLVYGVQVGDWATTAAAALLMLGLACLAALFPARRALRLSPTTALRTE
jgi:putative ABC transport system permease protein